MQNLSLLGYNITESQISVKFRRNTVIKSTASQPHSSFVPNGSYQFCNAWVVGAESLQFHNMSHDTFPVTLYDYPIISCPPGQEYTDGLCVNIVCNASQIVVDNECVNNNLQQLLARCNLLQSNTFIEWTFNDGELAGTVDFLVQWNWVSWISVGFAPTMSNTDMVVINIINNDQIQLQSCYSTGHNVTLPETQNYRNLLSALLKSTEKPLNITYKESPSL